MYMFFMLFVWGSVSVITITHKATDDCVCASMVRIIEGLITIGHGKKIRIRRIQQVEPWQALGPEITCETG